MPPRKQPTPVVHTDPTTLGFHPKVWRPVAAQVVALVVLVIATGTVDRAQLAQVAGIVLTLALGIQAPNGRVLVEGPGAPAE